MDTTAVEILATICQLHDATGCTTTLGAAALGLAPPPVSVYLHVDLAHAVE